jgi:hypothetical protein
MAAILDQHDNLNITALADGVKKVLPSYARPQFIRILRKVDMTGRYIPTIKVNMFGCLCMEFVRVEQMRTGSNIHRGVDGVALVISAIKSVS